MPRDPHIVRTYLQANRYVCASPLFALRSDETLYVRMYCAIVRTEPDDEERGLHYILYRRNAYMSIRIPFKC